jgi:two-component system copper resistance phosphate regulon response regulator CusR
VRLLLVEDDKQLRESIARGLREASYAVDEAADGTEALDKAGTTTYDAIVLDILLPSASGIDVCRTLRQHGNSVPILMLTALDALQDKIAGLDAGADDYLTKPFEFGELLARIRALLRRRGEVLQSEIVVGDLVIDTLRHAARRGARDIPLTSKEYTFLDYLARNAGRIVTRSELSEHVWDDTHNPFSNLIDVYASRLRRKIDGGEHVSLFSTHRGAGYMLAAPEPAPQSAASRQPLRARATSEPADKRASSRKR